MPLKNPSDFFELKEIDILEKEFALKKLEEEEKLKNKKCASPKEFFGEGGEEVDEIVEEVDEIVEEVDEIIEENIPLIEVRSYDNEIKELYEKVDSVSRNIPNIKNLIELKTKPEVEVKSYDEEIGSLNTEVKDLFYKIASLRIPDQEKYLEGVDTLSKENEKLSIKIEGLKYNIDGLKEDIAIDPPSTSNRDPLTPLNQKFATLDDLKRHYTLFLNRVQTQLGSIGGGGDNNDDGWEYVSDKNLESNPISLVADTWTQLTNDGTSSSTRRDELPAVEGVFRIYDTSTNTLDVTQCQNKGWLIFRFGVKVVPSVNNTTLKLRILWTQDPQAAGSYTFDLQSPGALLNDGAGVEYEKYDGMRIQIHKTDTIKVYSFNNRDITPKFHKQIKILEDEKFPKCILDGEVTLYNQDEPLHRADTIAFINAEKGDDNTRRGSGIVQVKADSDCEITDTAFFTIVG